MFMAIVNDTYADVKGEADMKPDEDFPIGEWFAARKEAFFLDIFHYFVFCIEDDVPIWTALERVPSIVHCSKLTYNKLFRSSFWAMKCTGSSLKRNLSKRVPILVI